MTADIGSFWTSLPGVLTALAGLIAAIGSLVGVLYSTGVLGKSRASKEGASKAGVAAPTPSGSDTVASEREEAPAFAPTGPVLRSAPAILTSEKVDAMLIRYGYFDQRRNPAGGGILHQYETQLDGSTPLVRDKATGLTWEMRGSTGAMRFEETVTYIDRLNAERAGGFADWRVPTAEEVMSLMEPDAIDGSHVAAVLRRGGNFFWTADELPGGDRAWVVYFTDGRVESESRNFNAWVRAVR